LDIFIFFFSFNSIKMSVKTHSGDFLKSKHMLCILVVLIVVILFLIYMSWDSSAGIDGNSCGAGCGCEGIQYAKDKKKEGLYNSPALQAMLGQQKQKERLQQQYAKRVQKEGFTQQFDVMKTRTAPKVVPTKAREGFSNDFAPPKVFRASMSGGSTPENPFSGPINL